MAGAALVESFPKLSVTWSLFAWAWGLKCGLRVSGFKTKEWRCKQKLMKYSS